MEENDYIKAIEKINLERLHFYHSSDYKVYRKKAYLFRLKHERDYYSLFLYYYQNIRDKIQRKFPTYSFHSQSYPYLWFRENDNGNKEILEEIVKKKKVVYTCVIGNYDKISSPILNTQNTDYILYTDNVELYRNIKIWKVFEIPLFIKNKCNHDPLLMNRYIKMHPYELFSDYDYSIYVDGNIEIVSDLCSVFEKSNNIVGISMHLHHKRIDLYDEGFYCISRFKGNRKKILELLKRYKQEGFPLYYGLCEACVISVDLKNRNSTIILKDWWKEFVFSDTGRDQLSFPYVLWKNHFLIDDMRFLGKDISINPKFYKRQHIHEM